MTDLQRYVPLGYPAPGGSPRVLQMAPVQVAVWAVVTCLLASPLCLVLPRLRWARPWLLAYVVWTAIGIWTSVSGSTASLLLSGLWYGTRERVRTMILPVYGVLAVAGACALATVLHRLVEELLRRRPRGRRPCGRSDRVGGSAGSAAPATAVAAVLLVTLVAAVALLPGTRAPLRADLARRAPVGASYARTFAWLARSTRPGGVAAYDRHLEMMTWSWADAGVRPLFGIPPLRDGGPGRLRAAVPRVGLARRQPGRRARGLPGAPLRRAVRRRGDGPGARLAGPLQPAAAGGQPTGRPRAPRRRHPGLRGQRGRAGLPGRALTQGRHKAHALP